MLHWKTEVVAANLETLSGRGEQDYAKKARILAKAGPNGMPATEAPTAPEELGDTFAVVRRCPSAVAQCRSGYPLNLSVKRARL